MQSSMTPPEFTIVLTVGTTQFVDLPPLLLTDGALKVISGLMDREGSACNIIIQYGRADPPHLPVSAVEVDDADEVKALYSLGGGRSTGAPPPPSNLTCNIVTVDGKFIRIFLYDLHPTLSAEISRSTYVVTHGGAGTIFECLTIPGDRRVLVVPNDSLMNAHQSELAGALESRGNVKTHVIGGVESFDQSLENTFDGKWKPKPLNLGDKREGQAKFQNLIQEEIAAYNKDYMMAQNRSCNLI